jgi:hypothetical protein
LKELALIDPVSDPSWDGFVKSQPLGWICHLADWKLVVEKAFPHIQGYFLVIREAGTIRAALPVYLVASWLTGKRLVSIPFATRSHPLFQDPEDLPILCEEIYQMGVRWQVSNVRIQCVQSELALEQVAGNVVANQFKIHTLLLSPRPQELFNLFHKTAVQQMVRRAEKSGIQVRALSGEKDLKSFYNLYSITRKRNGLPPHPEMFIRQLWERFATKEQMEGFVAEKDDAVVAGLLVFKFRGRVSAEYLCSDQKSHHLGVVQLLYWHAITEASQRGFEFFDFGRTDERNIGLMDFKRRWGTSVSSAPLYYRPVNSKKPYMVAGASTPERMFKAIFRRTPVPIMKSVGKICYRHMG